ncbi:nuclease [Scytonema hofmannii PCC 7110]|uniref:Nuclease n=1 Tax=Scytonema hofmannii PCC 7110 TaxID=128403 RepID=A0A139WS67_9CYAN|nr:DNA/RNA non-specific endonuclease [Scytonema hofmannii]KYC35269.1 nuclease [Scytonema hofmannii PCC 7110]
MFASKKLLILLTTLLLTLAVGCTILFPRQFATNPHLAFGNPSNASKADPNNYLIEKPQYILSYNRDKGIPNWVSWELNQSWLGEAPRSNNFRPDDTLPEGWYRVTPNDYTRSGFDKGHMVPSADRSNNPENNAATFFMTNIIPQAPDNNQGYWARLEDYERTLANQGNELHIISGVYGQKGTLAQGKVSIPARIFKIIIVTTPNQNVNSINESTRIITVDTPNIDGNRDADWTEFLTSVDAIEKTTGYNFLSNIDLSIQNIIESKVAQVTNLKSKSRTRKK